MVGIELSGPVAVLLGVIGAIIIYRDGKQRNMDTADMWAVGFFVGVFIPPIIGAVVIGVVYLDRRNRRPGNPHTVQQHR